MIAEILRSVTAAVVLGCAALFLTRDGPIREILRIAAGVLILTAAVQPFLKGEIPGEQGLLPVYADVTRLTEEQNELCRTELAAECERAIRTYFAGQGWELEPEVSIANGDVSQVILCFAQSYDWTKDDMDAFTEWSGIAPEKQEWIWRVPNGNNGSAAAAG